MEPTKELNLENIIPEWATRKFVASLSPTRHWNSFNEPKVPICPTHSVPMVLSFYDRPGSPPGNGWSCPKCIEERS